MRKDSRKTQTSNSSQWTIIAGMVVALVLVAVIVTLPPGEDAPPPSQSDAEARQAALASQDSPSIGEPGAKVHIVEFLDPACETCAVFYPMIKQWLAQSNGQLRLSVRHLAFHKGADYAVRILEASRNQDKYWETLEALLASQGQWTQNHAVLPEQILPAIAGVGLDTDRLLADMNSMEIMRRMEQDQNDAILLKVAKTPEYFVNGRPLPSFGMQQLLDLVREELSR